MKEIRFVLLLLTLQTSLALAQMQSGAPAGPTAIQLPLSGRNGQGGTVGAVTTPTAGVTNSVNTLNTSVSVQGPYTGSVPNSTDRPFTGTLSFREAIERGLEFNLGAIGLNQSLQQARGQVRVARSSLLPNLNGSLREVVQQTNLRAMGIRVSAPGFSLPSVVGPFNYFDLRATLTQNLADFTAWNNLKSAQELARATEFAAKDARDLVVLAVGGAYLQTIASRARVQWARSQVETARALAKQTGELRQAGLLPQLDVNRSLVEQQTQEQRLATLENDYAKQKINLARLTGLPVNAAFELADDVPFSGNPGLAVDEALTTALSTRADLKSAETQVKAAERALKAARAERLPSLAVSADYGAIGTNPSQANGTFALVGTLRLPIWQGGRVAGEIQQAQAALEQRRAEFAESRGRVEAEIRNAFLDLEAATNQVKVSQSNQAVARESLTLTRQRFEAGITDSVEVVQAQASVASADLDYITALFAHNLAKLSLARAMGNAEERVVQFLSLP
jgi:outer membrane protein TolC